MKSEPPKRFQMKSFPISSESQFHYFEKRRKVTINFAFTHHIVMVYPIFTPSQDLVTFYWVNIAFVWGVPLFWVRKYVGCRCSGAFTPHELLFSLASSFHQFVRLWKIFHQTLLQITALWATLVFQVQVFPMGNPEHHSPNTVRIMDNIHRHTLMWLFSN